MSVRKSGIVLKTHSTRQLKSEIMCRYVCFTKLKLLTTLLILYLTIAIIRIDYCLKCLYLGYSMQKIQRIIKAFAIVIYDNNNTSII